MEKFLETTVEDCWGSTIVIDHGESAEGKKLIVIYAHVGNFNVKENDRVSRGQSYSKPARKSRVYVYG